MPVTEGDGEYTLCGCAPMNNVVQLDPVMEGAIEYTFQNLWLILRKW